MSKNVWSRPFHVERKKILQQESAERKEYWDALTVKQQLECLDKRLGLDVGAKKQRTRLNALLNKTNVKDNHE